MSGFKPYQFGKYYLLEKFAVGGMAEIYIGKTFGVDGFEKQLAVKKILPHCSADKDFISMLIDEAKLSVLLSHANIVQVYDLGKVGDDYFISMEYINGPNLRDIVYKCREKNIKIPAELAVYIVSEVCKGLDYAHRKADRSNQPLNIVHRDVSPQNILISFEGEVKIVDFGIAKAAMNISHTMAGILKGKIAYMSPEQALGKNVDARTDIFSAGIVLYETITQSKLFTGESQFEVLKKIRTTKVTEEILPDEIPEKLKPVLAKSLTYYPKDRYENAGEMQRDLVRFLYQTYIDFTPQKLASFVRDLFADDLKERQLKAAHEAALEAQTSSMNEVQEALQENIVHREDTGITLKTVGTRAGTDTDVKLVSSIPELTHFRRRRLIRRTIAIILVLAMSAAAGFSYWKWFHGKWLVEPDTKTGTVSIATNPAGAKIFLEGKDTGLSTPAILEDLLLNNSYTLKLKKDGYADLTHALNLKTKEPSYLSFDLSKEMGTMEIISAPSGAVIFINDEDTGNKTPATISNLELGKELKITLKKDDYGDFEKTVSLNDMNTFHFEGKLEEIAFGSIKITTDPSGADIYLNGRDTGEKTPATLTKLEKEKQYTITVSKKDYKGFTRNITLTQDEAIVSGKLTDTRPKEPEKSSIKVDSDPSGAAIYLGGKNTGKTTPATIDGLEVKKTYSIRLSKPGYDSWSKKVFISNTDEQNVSANLKQISKEQAPEPKPQPIEQPEPSEPAQPESKPAKEPEAAPVGGFGTIKINSEPSGADVFINDEHKGKAPLTLTVPSGPVKVLVHKEGYIKYSSKVSLAPNETKNLGTVTLGELYGEVFIATTPPSATVVFDGQNIGARTPVTIRKVKRDTSHTLNVSLSGYRTWSRSFSMGDTQNKKFNIILEKE